MTDDKKAVEPSQPATNIDARIMKAFELGFLRAAEWAKRDDLREDLGSAVFTKDRRRDLGPMLDNASMVNMEPPATSRDRWMYEQGRLAERASRTPAPAAPDEDTRDAARYRQVRRGQHWSVINGIGDELRGEALDAATDAAIASSTKASGGAS